jgi:hypothetical protein
MKQFVDDETGYRTWISRHPDGYVVNAARLPRPSYLVLHRATCRTINGTPARGEFWTRDFRKTCSTQRSELENWARHVVGGKLSPCGLCRP